MHACLENWRASAVAKGKSWILVDAVQVNHMLSVAERKRKHPSKDTSGHGKKTLKRLFARYVGSRFFILYENTFFAQSRRCVKWLTDCNHRSP